MGLNPMWPCKAYFAVKSPIFYCTSIQIKILQFAQNDEFWTSAWRRKGSLKI
jgi:hypothetical protein